MIQEKLKEFFDEPFVCQDKNISFFADSKDNAKKIKDKFEIYKKTSDGSFLSNFKSDVNLRKNGFSVDCHGEVYRSSITGGVKWSSIDIMVILAASLGIYMLFSYFIK